jgi:hypothetical protein
MDTIVAGALLALGLFVGILTFLELGRRLGKRRLALDPEGAGTGTGAVEGAVFALVGLLIAFTFSGAASRFDARRDLIVHETNAIGTAWLRLDLLPDTVRPTMQGLFRRYLDARIETYRRIPDVAAVTEAMNEASRLQGEIWAKAVAAGRMEGIAPDATKLLLPALNDMFDLVTTRTMAAHQHPPLAIYLSLVVLSLAGALFAGYSMAGGKSRNWLHMLGFAAVMAATVYIIIDLEFPRLGLIRVDAFDQAMADLRTSMG